jgi:hypothetical protein
MAIVHQAEEGEASRATDRDGQGVATLAPDENIDFAQSRGHAM